MLNKRQAAKVYKGKRLGDVISEPFSLLHPLQTVPAHVPLAVLGEARVVGFFASVPAGTHHGYAGEQGPVAG